jgi:hypothetical protein
MVGLPDRCGTALKTQYCVSSRLEGTAPIVSKVFLYSIAFMEIILLSLSFSFLNLVNTTGECFSSPIEASLS